MGQSNGLAERCVRTLKDILRRQSNKKEKFTIRLSRALLSQRTRPHCTTKIVPSVALNNRKYVTPVDRINPKFHFQENEEIKNRKIATYEIGDHVLVRDYRDNKSTKWIEGVVESILGENMFE